MTMLGIDIPASLPLQTALRNWRSQADEVASLVMQAETLSDVPSGVAGLLDDIGSDGATLAQQIGDAVEQLTRFRIADLVRFEQLDQVGFPSHLRQSHERLGGELDHATQAEAIEIAHRIRDATAWGRPANAGDHSRLREIFASGSADEGSAEAAYVLALRGYPVHEALRLTTPDEVGSVYDHVAASITGAVAPAASGLSPDLFPIEYRRWHAEHSADEDAEPVVLAGLGRDHFVLPANQVTQLAAITATAAASGRTASRWLGAALAPLVETDSDAHVARIAEIARRDSQTALGLIDALGAAGVAQLPERLRHRSKELFDTSLPDYSAALALATHSNLLSFSGGDLIEAGQDGHPALPAELMLLNPDLDPEFLLASAVASMRAGGSAVGGAPDPRSVALQGVLNNGLVADFVSSLAEADELALLADPPKPFGADHPLAVGPLDTAPLTAVLTIAGHDETATRSILAFVHHRGAYEAMPLGVRLDDRLQALINENRSLDDERVATGLSAMLAVSAFTHFTTTEGKSIPLDSSFFSTYETVLLSGSGDHLVQASPALVGAVGHTNLGRGRTTFGLGPVADFVGAAHAVRSWAFVGNAELKDRAAENFARDASLVGIVLGLGSGAAATVGSTAASVLSLISGSDNTALAVSAQLYDELLNRSTTLRVAGLVALFGTGLVRTPAGRSVQLQRVGATGFRLVDDHDDEVELESTTASTHDLDDLPIGFANDPIFDALTVNGVSIDQLLTEIEAVDSAVDGAQVAATARLDSIDVQGN